MIRNRIYLLHDESAPCISPSELPARYLRCCQVRGDARRNYTFRGNCFDKNGVHRKILARSYYPAFYGGYLKGNTAEYIYMMRKKENMELVQNAV